MTTREVVIIMVVSTLPMLLPITMIVIYDYIKDFKHKHFKNN